MLAKVQAPSTARPQCVWLFVYCTLYGRLWQASNFFGIFEKITLYRCQNAIQNCFFGDRMFLFSWLLYCTEFFKKQGFGGLPQIAFFRKMVTSCNACSPLLCQVLVNCFFQTWRNLFLQNFWFSIFRQTENFTILKI